ncbi:MAG: hypothetical protein ACI8QS_000290 [Planctomycetota bacterium]|jgi:hypothetical protein
MRDRLLRIDSIGSADRADYDEALRNLFERKLSRLDRARYLVPTVTGLCMAIGLGSLALTEPASTPVETRIVLSVIAIIGAFWFVVFGRILRRGSVDLSRDRRVVCLAALVITSLQVLYFAWSFSTDPDALPGLIVGLLWVGLASVAYLVQRIRESELRVRVQLLHENVRQSN